MNQLGILTGVNPDNYLLNQRVRDNNFDHNNQLQLNDYLKGHPYQQQLANSNEFGYQQACNNEFPLYAPEYVKHQQKMLSGLPQMVPKLTQSTQSTQGQMPKEFKKHLDQNYESFSNFIPSNDPTSDLLLDLKDRPLTDFYHNKYQTKYDRYRYSSRIIH
jgi:hypothetical protein